MWNELGISGGTAIIILIVLYFVIKWAVKNGIKEAYSAITGKKTDEDVRNEKELKELGVEELKAKLAEQRQELFNLRFQHTTAQLEKTSSIPAARKNIARILTVLKEKE